MPSSSAKRRDDGTERPRRRGSASGEENADAAAVDHAIKKKVWHLADFIIRQVIGRKLFLSWCGVAGAVSVDSGLPAEARREKPEDARKTPVGAESAVGQRSVSTYTHGAHCKY